MVRQSGNISSFEKGAVLSFWDGGGINGAVQSGKKIEDCSRGRCWCMNEHSGVGEVLDKTAMVEDDGTLF